MTAEFSIFWRIVTRGFAQKIPINSYNYAPFFADAPRRGRIPSAAAE